MTLQSDPDIRSQQAADWFSRLNQRHVSTDDVHAFSAWRRDPANAAAYDRVQSMWDLSKTLGGDPEIEALVAKASGMPPRQRPRRTPSKAIGVVGFAALVLMIGAGLYAYAQWRPTAYEAGIGERRTLTLADGSHVTLDTGSRIEVRLSRETRTIRLLEGQALFDVAPDTERPFQVQAGATRITALGTLFDVRLAGRGARVVLVEGRVAVSEQRSNDRRWTLTPGQQINTAAPTPAVGDVDTAKAMAWTQGRLVFEHTTIRAAVAEANRYNRRPLVLEDLALQNEQISGTFNAGDQDALAAALADLYSLEVSRREDGAILLSRRAQGTGAAT
ncbi:MAG TPA: iron dicitrate transport regulator FecR [Brevundimonas sp.]|nr:iron dicitrate transport regulator FecR [Brevundimonas sp.]